MLPNGLMTALQMALPAGVPADFRAALALGMYREDVLLIPGLPWAIPSPSLGHVWPRSRRRCARFFHAAVDAASRGEALRGAFLLGRAAHVLIDMACPVHAQAVPHYLRDPFERYVEAHAGELAGLAVPPLPSRAESPEELVDSLAAAARREEADRTQSWWGRWLRRRGLRRPLHGPRAASQARELMPLAAAHARALLELYERRAGALA